MTTAVLGYKTLMDIVNQYTSIDSHGVYLEIAEILNRRCPLLGVLPMKPSNQIMSHIDSRRSYLPTPGTRRFNETISPTAAHTAPLSEGIAMYEDYSEVDAKLCRIQNDPNRYRMDEDKAKIEALTQALENGMFYGSVASDGTTIDGLDVRFHVSTHRPNGDTSWHYNVWLGTGTGSTTTSIWLIEFGENKVFAFFPKNLPAGLSREDKGTLTKQVSGAYMEMMLTHYSWDIGLFIKDERCIQRYANITADYSSGTGTFDEEILIAAKNQLPQGGEAPGTVLLVNRDIKTQMDIRAVNRKMNTYFTQEGSGDVWGRPVTRFQGIPVLVAEKILSTETALS